MIWAVWGPISDMCCVPWFRPLRQAENVASPRPEVSGPANAAMASEKRNSSPR